jgi:biopolymer transport protein ExbB
MENQLGILTAWRQGDAVTLIVALVLIGMSVASWIVIVVKALDIVRLKQMSQKVPMFWRSANIDEGLTQLQSPHDSTSNPFHSLAQRSHQAHVHQRTAQAQQQKQLDASDWVTRNLRHAIDNTNAHLQAGLAVLASIGATAPFIGLFGTVWGIYHALSGMGTSGQINMQTVSGPIGEALIMTALGLVVAVPAVLGYNALLRGNKFILRQLNHFAHDLHAFLITGSRIGQCHIQRECA